MNKMYRPNSTNIIFLIVAILSGIGIFVDMFLGSNMFFLPLWMAFCPSFSIFMFTLPDVNWYQKCWPFTLDRS